MENHPVRDDSLAFVPLMSPNIAAKLSYLGGSFGELNLNGFVLNGLDRPEPRYTGWSFTYVNYVLLTIMLRSDCVTHLLSDAAGKND